MPRIQLPTGGQTIEDKVPETNIPVEELGKPGDAISQLGNAVTSFGSKLLETRTRAENENFKFTKYNDLHKQASDFTDNLKLTSPEGAPGFHQKVDQFISDKINQDSMTAPSDEAKQAYLREANSLATQFSIHATGYENQQRAEKYLNDDQKAIASQAGDLVSKPDYNTYGQRVKNLQDHIQANVGVNYTAEDGRKVVDNAKKSWSLSIFKGLEAQGDKGIAQGLALLKANNSDVVKGLDPDHKASLLEQFSKAKVASDQISAQVIHSTMQDAIVAATQGMDSSSAFQKAFSQMKTNKSFTPEVVSMYKNQANIAQQVGTDIKAMQTMPRSQWDSLPSAQPLSSGPIKGIADRKALQAQFQTAQKQFATQQDNYPAETTVAGDKQLQSMQKQAQGGDPQAVQSYSKALLEKQKYLGIENPQITGAAEASFIGDLINKAPNSTAAAEQVVKLQQVYGPLYPKMMSELVQKQEKGGGGVDKSLAITGFLTDRDAIARVIENSKNGKAISTAFYDHPGFDTQFGNNLVNTIKEKLSPITSAINGGSSSGDSAPLAHSIDAQVNIESKKILLDPANDKLPIGKAVDQAIQRIVGNNFDLVQGGRSSVFVPKNVDGVNTDIVRGFVGHYSNPESLKNLNIAIQPNYLKSYDTKSEATDAFYNDLSKSSKWITNSDHTGVRLVQEDRSGNLNNVYDNNKKPIEKSFKEMTAMPHQSVLEKALSLPRKMWSF